MAENNSSAPLKTAPMIEAFEAAYSRDWNDPSGDEIKEIWHRAWQAALAAQAAATPALPATEDSSAGELAKAVHPDDAAVDALAEKMKAKLAKQRAKGYGGWDTFECTQQRLSDMLRDHVGKGDPVDVANFCAFLNARDESIAQAEVQAEPVAWAAVQRETVAKLLELARIVDRAVEDWGESQEDGSSTVIFHQEEADALGVILDYLDGLPDNPDPMILEGGTLKAARLLAAPQAQPADALDPIRQLIQKHAALLAENESAYFELCYHRVTGWMAWITDKPLCMPAVVNPDRKVIAQGQGDTAEEACDAAMAAAQEGDKA